MLNEDSLQQANQIIISGIEAHICVLQTALDLRAHGYEVFVVADAVSSRKQEDVKLGLARMQTAGCEIVSREMIAFEWLGSANNPLFRDIHKKYIR